MSQLDERDYQRDRMRAIRQKVEQSLLDSIAADLIRNDLDPTQNMATVKHPDMELYVAVENEHSAKAMFEDRVHWTGWGYM